MRKVTFYFRKHTQDSTYGYVYFRFYLKREKVNRSTLVGCEINDWDEKTCRIKKSDPYHDDKNLLIDNVASRINDIFVKFRLRNKVLTKSAFERSYNRPDDYETFFAFIKDNIKHVNKDNELSTIQNDQKVIRKVMKYNKNLHFDDITVEWIVDYFYYLKKDLKNNDNTAYKNLGIIKKYVRVAVKKGYMDENPFEDFKIKKIDGNFTYLIENEIHIFLKAYDEGFFESKYHKILEFFLFLCFSSLHIGDALQLKLEQFTDDTFFYVRQKTKKKNGSMVIVPVSDMLRKVLRNIVGTRKKGLIFEGMPAEQTINKFLKDIASELEIPKKLSTKSGRHTFATYFLSKTKDLTSLKEIMGHSDIRETLIYAHVLDEDKQEGILCFNKLAKVG